MTDQKNIFSKEIEIPEIVVRKAEDAFAGIREEGKDIMTENHRKTDAKKRGRAFRNRVAAAACVGILAVSGVTAAAAAYHLWGRGMQGNLRATGEQQRELIEQGYATVMEEEENYEELAVTVGKVTVKPVTVITDGKFAYLSFAVDGYLIGENIEPCFEFVNVYSGDDPDAPEGWLNANSSFYDGIVSDGTGAPVYDDGTPIAFDENGNIITHYADENGTLEYVITVFSPDPDASLLGETVHVDFKNLGNVYKAEFTGDLEGEWNFEIPLPGKSAAQKIPVGKAVEGTAFTVDSVEISPVSAKINYSVNGEVTIYEDENGVPRFCGVVLKDGTRLPYLGDGGMSGYTDESRTGAYVMSAFDRVIEPEQVEAILLQAEAGADFYTMELSAQ